MREMWNHPLGRHIIVILLVKLVAIYAIWWFFFRPLLASGTPDAARVSAVMVGTPGVPAEGHNAQSSVATKESMK